MFIAYYNGNEENFDSYEEARAYLDRHDCIDTELTGTTSHGDDVYSVQYFVKSDDLPEDFDDMAEEERQEVFEDLVQDGAYAPSIHCPE